MGSRIIASLEKYNPKYNLQKAIVSCMKISKKDEGDFPLYLNIGAWQLYIIAGRADKSSNLASAKNGIVAVYNHHEHEAYVKVFESPSEALKEQKVFSGIAYDGYREDALKRLSSDYLKFSINFVNSEWW